LSKKKIVPILVIFGSQEAVKKFGPKIGFLMNWSSHPSILGYLLLNLKGMSSFGDLGCVFKTA
jgi:hypothetical protein